MPSSQKNTEGEFQHMQATRTDHLLHSYLNPRTEVLSTCLMEPEDLFEEFVTYLCRYHGEQEELPIDITSLHRKIVRRHGSNDASYPALCNTSDEQLIAMITKLVNSGGLAVERIQAGPKTLIMLTQIKKDILRWHFLNKEGEASSKKPRISITRPSSSSSFSTSSKG